jgi:hypothetical protein
VPVRTPPPRAPDPGRDRWARPRAEADLGAASTARARDAGRLLGDLLAGAAIAGAIGDHGIVHDPTGGALVGVLRSASIDLTR